MLKKLFNKKANNDLTLYAPIDGEMIPIEEVPDPVFSEKMAGDGVAFKPANGKILAPVRGEIIQVFPTKHAIGIRTDNGVEILLHIGIDTVELGGEGLHMHVKTGDFVEMGDKLMNFDTGLIQEKATSTITPLVITNTDETNGIYKLNKGNVTAGQDEVLIVKR